MHGVKNWVQPRDSLAWHLRHPGLLDREPLLAWHPIEHRPRSRRLTPSVLFKNGSIGNSGRRLDGVGLIEDGNDEILVGT